MNISREELTRTLRKVFPFDQLAGDQLNLLLEKAELVYFPEDKMIYVQGSLAESFYIVLEGKVEISQHYRRAVRNKNLISPYFCFGEDLFLNMPKRQSSARAVGDVVLIKFSLPVF